MTQMFMCQKMKSCNWNDVDILQHVVNVDMMCFLLGKCDSIALNSQTMCDFFWQN